jgi:glycosyltransferase involved in cell wall biosynthesis
LAPARFARAQRYLRRRHEPEIPAERVRSAWSYDVALRLESRLAARRSSARGRVARWRTRRFDRLLTRTLAGQTPRGMLVFSDVGSEHALPYCRDHGIRTVLSIVHGDVREERAVLEREAATAPDFFPLYLADGPIDRDELSWLHDRRLCELVLADKLLVPSEHIADVLVSHGTMREKIAVVPYAADTSRFRPASNKAHGETCTFLFAGGITQRKGIKYLLEAWRRVRRPGWKLQLLGALPSDPGPLAGFLDDVELLGRVAHAEVPDLMASADVFVFPSLFEGSAVVTYEALACGLPVIVTPEAGSVARDGMEGVLVPSADSERLANAMERLGTDPALRAAMSQAARSRAEQFDWTRYHAAVSDVLRIAIG